MSPLLPHLVDSIGDTSASHPAGTWASRGTPGVVSQPFQGKAAAHHSASFRIQYAV